MLIMSNMAPLLQLISREIMESRMVTYKSSRLKVHATDCLEIISRGINILGEIPKIFVWNTAEENCVSAKRASFDGCGRRKLIDLIVSLMVQLVQLRSRLEIYNTTITHGVTTKSLKATIHPQLRSSADSQLRL